MSKSTTPAPVIHTTGLRIEEPDDRMIQYVSNEDRLGFALRDARLIAGGGESSLVLVSLDIDGYRDAAVEIDPSSDGPGSLDAIGQAIEVLTTLRDELVRCERPDLWRKPHDAR